MQICGIVAEFNPFHNGHQYIINKFKTADNCILSVMSGNYVQRGEPALLSKFARAKAALNCGVDLVVELPSPWSCSCAQNFAFGAVSLMKNCNVDKLVFGSELGDIDTLYSIAKADKDLVITEQELKSGKTYAKIRQEKLSQLLGEKFIEHLTGSNNNLAIEYLKAMSDLDCRFLAETVKRFGAHHDSAETTESICSATHLRELISSEQEFASYVPYEILEIYQSHINNGKYLDYQHYKKSVVSYLRRIEDFSNLPDISEGIDNKLKKELISATTLDGLAEAIKSKRYTLARVRRLLLSAFLDMDNEWFLKEAPYINVLGFTEKGEAALREIANSTKLPIVISCKPNKELSEKAKLLLEKECMRNDVYMSLLSNPSPCGLDYTNGIIKKRSVIND